MMLMLLIMMVMVRYLLLLYDSYFVVVMLDFAIVRIVGSIVGQKLLHNPHARISRLHG